MPKNYSYLEDELAVTEIRKHKWIESEKIGKEIGFASAALDWIKRHGHAWKLFRQGLLQSDNFFTEKRVHRRFMFRFPLQIQVDNILIATHTRDINLLGLSCNIPRLFPMKTSAKATILFQNKPATLPQSRFQFDTHISRSIPHRGPKDHIVYSVFLLFSEEVRDFLRLNAPHFIAASQAAN